MGENISLQLHHPFYQTKVKKIVHLVKVFFFVFLENHICLVSQILLVQKASKEYVLVKHEGHLLLSWALSYSEQFYAMHNPQWIYDLTLFPMQISKVDFVDWFVLLVNVCFEFDFFFL